MTIRIETNGFMFRVVQFFGENCVATVGEPFETLEQAEAFRADYERRYCGEWAPVLPKSADEPAAP